MCTIDLDHCSKSYDFKLDKVCPNNKIGSVRLHNADAGTKIAIQTQTHGGKSDPYFVINVKKDIDGIIGIGTFNEDYNGEFMTGKAHGLRGGFFPKYISRHVSFLTYVTGYCPEDFDF